MTREEQRILKELRKYLALQTKMLAKQYKLKKKDYIVFTYNDSMFYSAQLHMYEDKTIGVSFVAKPFWLDDILWKILKMDTNVDEPVSIRGVGAFTINSLIKKDKVNAVSNKRDVDRTIKLSFEQLIELSGKYNEEDFLNNYTDIIWQKNEIKVIVLIFQKRYAEALQEIEKLNEINNSWLFKVGNKDFGELAKEYICDCRI